MRRPLRGRALPQGPNEMRIGVISDTHGHLDDLVESLFRDVGAIIHAGDIGKVEVVDRLEAIAPVIAVEGNNDWFNLFPTERVEELAGRRILIRHIFGEASKIGSDELELIARALPDIVIFGHSHRPYVESFGGTILFNPGSAGAARAQLPRTVGLLWLGGSRLQARILNLDRSGELFWERTFQLK